MNSPKVAPQRPGSPAASHMLWFFVLPIIGLLAFATWKLSNALLNPENLTLESRLIRLETAINAGERWKEAYGVSQEIHKKKSKGEWTSLPVETKKKVFETFDHVLSSNESDARVARYLLVTLGQLGEVEALPILKRFHSAQDPELRFFSVWAYAQTILTTKKWDLQTSETTAKLLELMKGEDTELKKVVGAFLSQGPLNDPGVLSALQDLLQNPSPDLRWSAAVALLPRAETQDKAAVALAEMFDLQNLRKADFGKFSDLKQALSAARSAIEKVNHADLKAKARLLAESVDPANPEGRTIREALQGI